MKWYCCCCLLLSNYIFLHSYGQYYFSANNKEEPELLWEVGGAAGAMNCLTDLGGRKGVGKKFIKDINWNKTQFCGSFFVSSTWHALIAIRLEGTWGQVTADDNVLNNVTGVAKGRYLRNLSFRSIIAELVLLAEFHPLFLIIADDAPSPLFSPYLTGGIGVFYYNPQAKLNNNWVDLRSLHTEGEGFREYPDRPVYKPSTWCIPIGAGIKYDAARLVNLRFEIVYRITGTDYLDDVSQNYIDPALFKSYLPASQAALAVQLADRTAAINSGIQNKSGNKRGNPKDKDAYFSFSFKLGIALGRGKKQ
jgi:hypothetical protein